MLYFRLLGDPDNFRRAVKDNKIMIVSTGKLYDGVGFFNEGLAQVKLNNKYSFINENGEEICDFKYDYVEDFSNGLAQVEINKKQGYINKYSKEICPVIYQEAWYLEDMEIIMVVKDDKVGFLDIDGYQICECIYDDCSPDDATEHFIPVCIDEKWGFINKECEEICDMKFDVVISGLIVELAGQTLPLIEIELDEEQYGLAVEIDGELRMVDEV